MLNITNIIDAASFQSSIKYCILIELYNTNHFGIITISSHSIVKMISTSIVSHFLLDINFFKFSSGEEAPFWTIIGVLIGAIATGGINYFLQKNQFKHNIEMFRLQNQSKEQVKEYLLELLNHKKYTDREFRTIKKRIGAFSDEELRLLLIEVGAKKSENTKGEETWYLKSREAERPNSIKPGFQ